MQTVLLQRKCKNKSPGCLLDAFLISWSQSLLCALAFISLVICQNQIRLKDSDINNSVLGETVIIVGSTGSVSRSSCTLPDVLYHLSPLQYKMFVSFSLDADWLIIPDRRCSEDVLKTLA